MSCIRISAKVPKCIEVTAKVPKCIEVLSSWVDYEDTKEPGEPIISDFCDTWFEFDSSYITPTTTAYINNNGYGYLTEIDLYFFTEGGEIIGYYDTGSNTFNLIDDSYEIIGPNGTYDHQSVRVDQCAKTVTMIMYG